jgi:single-strand DNA-binding protein
MPNFNKIILMGHLGKDPDLRYTPQGKAVCSFTMATTEKRRDAEPQTVWFKVTTWGHTAEAASKYLTKGTAVYIEGRLRIEEWTDRDGKNRYTLDVQASDMQFIGPKDDSHDIKTIAAENGVPVQNVHEAAGANDDIPF